MAYVEEAWRKSSVSKWNRGFKDGLNYVHDNEVGSQKAQRSNGIRVKTQVNSDRKLSERLRTEELNMNEKIMQQMRLRGFGNERKNPQRWGLEF